jgi:hypothetical protein
MLRIGVDNMIRKTVGSKYKNKHTKQKYVLTGIEKSPTSTGLNDGPRSIVYILLQTSPNPSWPAWKNTMSKPVEIKVTAEQLKSNFIELTNW